MAREKPTQINPGALFSSLHLVVTSNDDLTVRFEQTAVVVMVYIPSRLTCPNVLLRHNR